MVKALYHNVKMFQARFAGQTFDFFRDDFRHFRRRNGVETPKQSSEIEGENGVAIKTQALFHDLPDSACLHKAMQKQDLLFVGVTDVSVASHLLSAAVHFADTAEVVPQEMINPTHSLAAAGTSASCTDMQQRKERVPLEKPVALSTE